MSAPKVSVIVPVFNVEPYVRQCMDSLLGQTVRDIEVVCVDDGSTDGSAAVLEEYAAKDSRVKVVSQPNSGTVVARKRAVAAASGEWCAFVDPDDWLEPCAFERMLVSAAKAGADAVQCGFVIEETEPRPAELRAKTEAYFNPPPAVHDGASLTKRIFLERKQTWNLIGRMIRSDVCKPAFAEQCDAYSTNETDVYATFHVVQRIRRLVVTGERLYHYKYGVGISTLKSLSFDRYMRTMGKLDTWNELVDFAARSLPGDKVAADAVMAIGRMMAANQFSALAGRVSRPAERARALEALLAKCPHDLLADALAERYADNPSALAMALDSAGGLPRLSAREVRRIGILYFHLTTGGVQRVISAEMEALRARGIEVTLFLDDNGENIEVPIADGVGVVRLPRAIGPGAAPAAERMRALACELSSRRIDVLHTHQYLTDRMIWDLLAAKLVCGVPFFVHYHSVRTAPLWALPAAATYCNEPYWLRQCDGLFALTPFDAALFQAEGVRAHCVPNPTSASVLSALSSPLAERDGRLVLWIGRFSEEKHPGDAIRVFGALHRADPNLRFAMVGGGDAKVEGHVRELAEACGLADALEFAGSVPDPSPWRARASVLISTSDYEGFPLVALEALADGVPIVAYAQPQIPLFRGNPAVVQVRPRSASDMACAVLDLLARSDMPAVRQAARASVRPFPASEMADALLSAFAGTEAPAQAFTAEDLRDLLELQRRALASLHTRRTRQIAALVGERGALRAEVAELRSATTLRKRGLFGFIRNLMRGARQ